MKKSTKHSGYKFVPVSPDEFSLIMKRWAHANADKLQLFNARWFRGAPREWPLGVSFTEPCLVKRQRYAVPVLGINDIVISIIHQRRVRYRQWYRASEDQRRLVSVDIVSIPKKIKTIRQLKIFFKEIHVRSALPLELASLIIQRPLTGKFATFLKGGDILTVAKSSSRIRIDSESCDIPCMTALRHSASEGLRGCGKFAVVDLDNT